MCHGTKGLCHGRTVYYGQHGQAQRLCQISAAGCAIKQAHHAFNQNDIGFLRRCIQQCPAVGFTAHP